MQKKTIAIIEDDLYISDLLYESLTREGYGLLRAYSGTEALYLLEKYGPNMILLDLMRRQRHRYENGDRELKEAIANISHDLRTPLTAICGYLELLEQEEHLDNSGHIADHTTDQKQVADRGHYLAQIRNRTETMKDLTEQLFTYSLIVSDSHRQPEHLTMNGI